MELIEKRAKQLYEIDVVLFEGVELPVFIPDKILESQKALSKKGSSPKKVKNQYGILTTAPKVDPSAAAEQD